MARPIENREKLMRLLTEAVPHGDYEFIDSVVDPEVKLPEMPGGGQGLAGYKQGIRMYGAAIEHESISAEDVVADGDLVAIRLVVKGRHIGDLFGIPATGRRFAIEQVVFAEFREGLVVRFSNLADRASLFQQLTETGPS